MPKLRIPDTVKVLKRGIFPKIVLSVLGIAILISSPTDNPNLFANT